MAKITRNCYMAIDTQSAQGTVNATVAALTSPVAASDGAVLGVRSTGIAESGIDFSVAADISEKADVAGSFTKQAATFLGETVDWSITCELKGNGATASTPPVDGDFVLDNGLNALWAGVGMSEAAWGSGVGSALTPAALTYTTAKIWVNGLAWVVMDSVGSASIKYTPAGIATVQFKMQGIVSSFAEATIASMSYGAQTTLSAPIVQGVGNAWGQTRGFNELSIEIDNAIEKIGDSNASAGYVLEQGARTIKVDSTHFIDDGDLDYERANLIATSAPTDDLSFTIGTVATDGSTIDAVRMLVNNPQVRTLEPVALGAKAGMKSSAVCTGAAANTEFNILFV